MQNCDHIHFEAIAFGRYPGLSMQMMAKEGCSMWACREFYEFLTIRQW